MKKFTALLLAFIMLIPVAVCAEDYPDGITTELATVTSSSNNRLEYLVSTDESVYSDGEIATTAKEQFFLKDGSYYLIYRVPVPEINEGSVFEDFNLYYSVRQKHGYSKVYPKSDVVHMFKLPNDEWDLDTISTSEAFWNCVDKANENTYPVYDSYNYDYDNQETQTGGRWYRITTDITGYANECLKNNQSIMYIAVTFDESIYEKIEIFTGTTKVSIDVKAQYNFKPNVVYKAYEPLVVSSDADVSDYDNTVSSNAVEVGSPFKTAFKITNNTGADKDLKLVFACYTSANELVGLVFEDAKSYTGNTEVLISRGLKIPETTSYVKAFIMDENCNPVTTFEKINVVAN